MTAGAWILLAVAGVVAVADWVAVARRPSRAETFLKPAVMVALLGVLFSLHAVDTTQRTWFAAAVVLSLAGDVFLLPSVDRFVPGLASFLLAHVAYIAGFLAVPRNDVPLLGPLFALLLLVPGAVRIIGGVRASEPELTIPVVVYIGVISAMVLTSGLHGSALGFVGALVFAGSDTTLALDRFVAPRRWMPILVMVSYHGAQALLVTSVASKP